MSTVGDRIKEARIARGLTQDELGKKAGYSSGRSAINKIEVGKSYPSQKYIIALADALGVSVDWLLGNTEEQRMNALEKAFNQRPEMRALFDAAEDCTAEEIERVVALLEALKK